MDRRLTTGRSRASLGSALPAHLSNTGQRTLLPRLRKMRAGKVTTCKGGMTDTKCHQSSPSSGRGAEMSSAVWGCEALPSHLCPQQQVCTKPALDQAHSGAVGCMRSSQFQHEAMMAGQ